MSKVQALAHHKSSKRRRGRPTLTPEARERRTACVRRVLYTREQTAAALGGISRSMVIRLENDGKLSKVRFVARQDRCLTPLMKSKHSLLGGRSPPMCSPQRMSFAQLEELARRLLLQNLQEALKAKRGLTPVEAALATHFMMKGWPLTEREVNHA